MGLLREDVLEVRAPGRDNRFSRSFLLGDFSGDGSLGNGLSVQPLLLLLDEAFDPVIGV